MTCFGHGAPTARLISALTDACPRWAVWKSVEAALSGSGDVDSVAPKDQWPAASSVFADWAFEVGFAPVVECRHLPGALFLVACDKHSDRLVELDLYSHVVLRGTSYIDADELAPLTRLDAPGYRRVRPGAEGLFLVLANLCGRAGGRRQVADDRIRTLLASDTEGVERAARLFGRFSRNALRCADAVRHGTWDRGAAARWQAGAIWRIRRAPLLAASRLRFGIGRPCPLLAALAAGRRVPGPRESWLEDVGRTHSVVYFDS